MVSQTADIGKSQVRYEDARLLTGRGAYTDDHRFADEAHMVVLRSPAAMATIRAIDSTAARALPGVIGIFTAADIKQDGLGTIQPARNLNRADGSPMVIPPFSLLAEDCVRFVGDAVAIVIAETIAQAEDASEAIVVDYAHGKAVTDLRTAVADGAPAVWPEVPGNVGFVFELGDRDAVDKAFARAAHVTELTLRISRVLANPIEPRAAIGAYDAASERFTLHIGTQTPNRIRYALAKDILRVAPDRVRVIAKDTGGSFGMKNCPYPEYGLVLWAARKLGRTIRWLPRRSEAILSDHHGRDNLTTVSLALDDAGIFLGLRVRTLANLGAYFGTLTPHAPTGNLGGLAGVYRTPHIHVEVRGVHTHTQPTTTYRGAGRPEATYVIERIIDAAARELGIDRAELRRRNMITADEMPFQTGLTYNYDCGDFPGVMARTLEIADWDGFPARLAAARERGLLRGIGITNPIEIAAGPQAKPNREFAGIGFDAKGDAIITLGSCDAGQGHATAFRQIATHLLGIEPERVSFIWGDTDAAPQGVGTFGSRTMSAGGTALAAAATEIITQGTGLAAEMLGAQEELIEFDAGRFRVSGTERHIGLHDLAADTGGIMQAEIVTQPEAATFPNGCHICEVEIDPETGQVTVENYTVVDDIGTVINPLLATGQLHGGVAQGISQALMEEVVFDSESGQLLSGSFVDYAMPRADDIPPMRVASNPVPTRANPLGVKGVGEAGTVGALPVVINAVIDALAPLGIRHIDMPASPTRVWHTIDAARKSNAGISL